MPIMLAQMLAYTHLLYAQNNAGIILNYLPLPHMGSFSPACAPTLQLAYVSYSLSHCSMHISEF